MASPLSPSLLRLSLLGLALLSLPASADPVSTPTNPAVAAAVSATTAPGPTAGVALSGERVQASTLNYDVDAVLTYIDGLQRPDLNFSRQTTGSGGGSGGSASQPRTLGLRRLSLGLDWQAASAAGLHLVLRPDAANRASQSASTNGTVIPPREFDNRSGDPGMKPQPTIRLLDAYQLRLQPATDINLAIGVWDSLATSPAAYPELLGFGLNILLPAKFAGARLHWQKPGTGPDTALHVGPGAQPSTFSFDLYVLEGDEDRAEALGTQHSTFDTAPVGSDPYHGGAGGVNWRLDRQLTVGLLVGYLLQNDGAGGTGGTNMATNAAAAGNTGAAGTYDEVFGQLSLMALLPAFGRDAKLGVDVRYLRSRGRGTIADQSLQSVMATGSYPVAHDLWALVGAAWGKGDRWLNYQSARQSTAFLDGYQVEAGVLSQIGQNLSLQLMLSHEYRTLRAGGITSGGFQDGSGNRSTIQRMGLELTYKLNQNA